MVKLSNRLTFPLCDSIFTVVLNVKNVPFITACLKQEDQSRCFYSLRRERWRLIKTAQKPVCTSFLFKENPLHLKKWYMGIAFMSELSRGYPVLPIVFFLSVYLAQRNICYVLGDKCLHKTRGKKKQRRKRREECETKCSEVSKSMELAWDWWSHSENATRNSSMPAEKMKPLEKKESEERE